MTDAQARPLTDEAFPALRRRLFAIAYRMLGSVAEAEDIVQEAFLRLHRARQDGTAIESEPAYLSTVTTRLAIDHLRSARVRRETYVGPWLPEPIVQEREPHMVRQVEVAESLSMAFLLILEALSPVERAVFLLREVFEYDYDEIAAVVDKTPENCRQIFARARRHIDAGKPRFESSPEKRDALAARFFDACRRADLDALVSLLAADATFVGDGGGKATATGRAVLGAERVARLLYGIFSKGASKGVTMKAVEVNGQPGVITLDAEGRILTVFTIDILEGTDTVAAIHSVVNPDKLRHLGEVSELLLLPRRQTMPPEPGA